MTEPLLNLSFGNGAMNPAGDLHTDVWGFSIQDAKKYYFFCVKTLAAEEV